MPELPEVETTRRGIIDALEGQTVQRVIIRQHRLRWPIPNDLPQQLEQQCIRSIGRRSKYLLFHTDTGTLLLHLGMSGRLRLIEPSLPADKHDHVDLVFTNIALRFTDPRRFGSLLWTDTQPEKHVRLKDLGPEPLETTFNGDTLFDAAQHRKSPIKTVIMNANVVVGVGNIYASEALFRAGIAPTRSANRISRQRYQRLADAIKSTLHQAIRMGGTTLNDFYQTDGKPGYFQQQLNVYDRAQEPCTQCSQPIRKITQAQRSTFYCPHCQH